MYKVPSVHLSWLCNLILKNPYIIRQIIQIYFVWINLKIFVCFYTDRNYILKREDPMSQRMSYPDCMTIVGGGHPSLQLPCLPNSLLTVWVTPGGGIPFHTFPSTAHHMSGMMKKNEGAGALSQFEFAKKPEELSFLKFLYNGSTGEVLGRSASSWGETELWMLVFNLFSISSQDYRVLHHLLRISCWLLRLDAASVLPNSEWPRAYLAGWQEPDRNKSWHGVQTSARGQEYGVYPHLVQGGHREWKLGTMGSEVGGVCQGEQFFKSINKH